MDPETSPRSAPRPALTPGRLLLLVLSAGLAVSIFLRVHPQGLLWASAALVGILLPAAWVILRRPEDARDPVAWTDGRIRRMARTHGFMGALFFGTFLVAHSLTLGNRLPAFALSAVGSAAFGGFVFRESRRALARTRDAALHARKVAFE